ncbi:Bifunctional protein BirA [Anaerohalosphaera lusitana]|uniref:Bifunctional protein BirA n=1 Tax=Anaerohalosphaera lusitana TaxID=1936003 RepID=A0A1U9NKG9_9BACT|nr:biotin--[acetyl-CoA-carboxylase] ligase [Anaerohalosphaera lusitana]AQT68399.1 Bifunctional protein BirA [Anaerohalosphaera lusitana]
MGTDAGWVDRLDVDRIEEAASGCVIGRRVVVYQSTRSTNDIAWEYAKGAESDGLVVFAEEQSGGRGRRGNKWLSSAGQSLLCSVIVSGVSAGAELLTLASAVATAEAIREYAGVSARIKWPNDVMVGGKKICGILVESRAIAGRKVFVVGIGINCHQGEDFFGSEELRMPGTSVDLAMGEVCDRNELAGVLLRKLDVWVGKMQADEKAVIDGWGRLSSQLGEYVTVEHNNRRYSGICAGVDPVEGLILRLDGGAVRMFEAGQTTIVKHS